MTGVQTCALPIYLQRTSALDQQERENQERTRVKDLAIRSLGPDLLLVRVKVERRRGNRGGGHVETAVKLESRRGLERKGVGGESVRR